MDSKKMLHCRYMLTRHPVALGLLVRLLVAWLGPLLLDSGELLPGVAYTDIDYHVFSDAAQHVKNHGSPYDRHTYRYTPFLAWLLACLPFHRAGVGIFCVADTICGWMILQLRQRRRRRTATTTTTTTSNEPLLSDALWWLYNPFAINICTRGSAESLLVLLPVLSTLWILLEWKRTRASAITAGVCHGIAIHCKLYPIIYSVSFALCFVADQSVRRSVGRSIMSLLVLWSGRLWKEPLVWWFATTTIVTFVVLTLASYRCYGFLALQESLLYHLSRTDHRHNYSMHWYGIYLSQTTAGTLPGLLYFVPQVVLLALLSLVFADRVEVAIFLETFLFVTFNKVITAQYFTWYLSLLPLCSDQWQWSNDLLRRFGVWVACMLVWLGTAYRLEMQGRVYYRWVWVASILYFAANVSLMRALLQSLRRVPRKDAGKSE